MWTDQQVERVRVLAGKGLSATEIGRLLGSTRSAVIGICWRRNIKLKCGKNPAHVRQMIITQHANRTGPYRNIPPAKITLAGPEWSWPESEAA